MDETSSIGSAQRRIVDHLKRAGDSTTADLADALGVTTQAVRPQLAELEEGGLVVSKLISTGVRGRPPVGWALSARAIGLFPDRHGDLTVELIAAMRATVGEAGLDAVIKTRDETMYQAVAKSIPDGADIEERTRRLADHRAQQGYMAEVVTDGDDLLLIEHHCPICSAATECQGLCRGELELFKNVIGPDADIERTEHILSGGQRCVYRITPRSTGN